MSMVTRGPASGMPVHSMRARSCTIATYTLNWRAHAHTRTRAHAHTRTRAHASVGPPRGLHSAVGGDAPCSDSEAIQRFDRATKGGREMGAMQELLARAVASIVGKGEERAVASLFTPGGTHALKGEFQGIDDFEVLALLVVLADRATP